MIALTIHSDDVKGFMNQLLAKDTFDGLEVRGVQIHSFTKFEIDCQDLSNKESIAFHLWQKIRPYTFNIIKGEAKPTQIKIIFSLPKEEVEAFHPNAAALTININFDSGGISITNGITHKSFSLDKTIDEQWDSYVVDFFRSKGIATKKAADL